MRIIAGSLFIRFMKRIIFSLSFVVVIVAGFNIKNCLSQSDTLSSERLNVYLDCSFCDPDYIAHIKREVDYVNYVRARQDADVHIMISREPAANKGFRITAYLLGQHQYAELTDTLRFNVEAQATYEQIRQKSLNALRTGLTPYIIKTPYWKNLSVEYSKPKISKQEVTDKWNYWIFEVSSGGNMAGEKSRQGYELKGEIDAEKVTKDIKLDFAIRTEYNKTLYKVNSHTITSIHRNYEFDGLVVKSLSQHWSAGGFEFLQSSRYRNMKISSTTAPALEYNVFPYSEATTRQLTFLYRPGFRYNLYEDTTIFNKIQEKLFRQSLSVNYKIRKKWGSIYGALRFSHYFHEFSKNRTTFDAGVSLNLVKGLNIQFGGKMALIHDQLYLPKGDATTEEILTEQRQLATDYEFQMELSISYTFGSIYNNIVNPRF
jgi:hypothetical protein